MELQTSSSNGTLFINGVFFTSGPRGEDPVFHDYMFIKDGLIESIGAKSDQSIDDIRKKNPSIRDLKGKIVLPGFVDGHIHLLILGQSLQKVDLTGCTNLEEIRTRIKDYAQAHPDKDRILCRGWMHSMTNSEAKATMLDDLDPRPVYIDSKDLHFVWCNTAALKELGADELTAPAGGTIDRDDTGKATGLLGEAATFGIVWPHLANLATMDEKLGALRGAMKTYNEAGYTGMVDMAMDENGWEALLALREADGPLSVSISAYWLIRPDKDPQDQESHAPRVAQVERAIALNKKYNSTTSPDLRIVGIKVICDGIVDACTAGLLEPYSSNGLSTDPVWTPSMLSPVIEKANSAGLQCALHAIGDATVRMAIDAIGTHIEPEKRPRIEHLELTSPGDAELLHKYGITASIQPVHSDPSICQAWPKLLGPHRLERAFAYREMQDKGATLALGSDSPTAPHAPLHNLYVATTRKSAKNPEGNYPPINRQEALELSQAISGATRGAAYSCFDDLRTGSLEAGLRADFVIVDMEHNPEKLLAAKVQQTWYGGRKVFDDGT
ncbi:amidohydrolase family protein [Eremomyces bilateralis CBS 781.70]|uniref:Amidohydrolase family protein n=1 Tax=Eremomyces bilateralis CBS 781.70 TaxID=1392243 RepID=A0A6G1FUU0_9PEZI|nr:amidohydrolase family protein [Eremomyces bilateralis CBS 781.70]KAF1809523.1 amidohydrolase family protein [Eremomyces bilateralis CBS 781.70]